MGTENAYHQQSPDGVVEEDDGSSHEHGETCEFVQLRANDVSNYFVGSYNPLKEGNELHKVAQDVLTIVKRLGAFRSRFRGKRRERGCEGRREKMMADSVEEK